MGFKDKAARLPHNLARIATGAGLALALAVGGIAGVGTLAIQQASAATTQVGYTGGILIDGAVTGYYYAYKIFDGSFQDFEQETEDEDGNTTTSTVTKMGDLVLNEDYKAAVLEALAQMADLYDKEDLSDEEESVDQTYYPVLFEYDDDGNVTDTYMTDREQADAILDKFLLMDSHGRLQTFANLLAFTLAYNVDADGNTLSEDGFSPTLSTYTNTGAVTFDDINCGYWLVTQETDSSTVAEGDSSTNSMTNNTSTDYTITSAILFAVDGEGPGVDSDGNTIDSTYEYAAAKVSVPEVDKFVKDDDTDSSLANEDTDDNGVDDVRRDSAYDKTADSGATTDYTVNDDGEIEDAEAEMCSITYKVTGTVAANIADYEYYYYAFHDQLPEVISFGTNVTSSTTSSRLANKYWEIVAIPDDSSVYYLLGGLDDDGNNVEYFSATYTADEDGLTTVTWACNDLIAAFEELGVPEDEWATIQIELVYNFPLTDDEIDAYLATVSSLSYLYAETNYVWLETSNNPYENNPVVIGNGNNTGDTTETVEELNRVYSFNVQISKVDEDGQPLSGATFTLTAEVIDDDGVTSTVDVGYLVIDDGDVVSWVSASTDDEGDVVRADGTTIDLEDGVFLFTGLEADVTYTLTETRVPSGYKSIDPISFVITAHMDEDDEGHSYTYISVDPESTTDPSGAAIITTTAYEGDATVHITITNVEGYDLPLTGQAGIVAGIIVGAAVIAISAVAIRRRNSKKDIEQAA